MDIAAHNTMLQRNFLDRALVLAEGKRWSSSGRRGNDSHFDRRDAGDLRSSVHGRQGPLAGPVERSDRRRTMVETTTLEPQTRGTAFDLRSNWIGLALLALGVVLLFAGAAVIPNSCVESVS